MTLETLIPLKARTGIAALAFAAVMMPLPAAADAFMFSTGNPDGQYGDGGATRGWSESLRSRAPMTSSLPPRPRSLGRPSPACSRRERTPSAR